MKGWITKILTAAVNVAVTVMLTGFALFGLYLSAKIFIWDSYPVNSSSMSPTILAGDRIMVNKQIFGPRLYSNWDFLEGKKLKTKRLKGFRGIMYNDIVVFNHSTEDRWYHTEFSIGIVYVKRCIGLPGDTISIVDGIYKNSSLKDTVGLYMTQARDRNILLDSNILAAYPFDSAVGWTIKDFGPMYLPRKGDTISLDLRNMLVYKRYIEHETFSVTEIQPHGMMINGVLRDKYVFRDNYYFMAGDNVADSRDSRYFGLIPEEFIVGVASRVVRSREPYSGRLRKERTMKRL